MASAIICLATNQKVNFSKYIFDNMVKNLESGVKFLLYPRFVQVFLDKQVEGMSKHKGIYVIPSHTKKVFANMMRLGKGFSRKVTPLSETMMVQATEDMGEDSAAPTDSYSTHIHTQPSLSKPQNKNSKGNRGRLEKKSKEFGKEKEVKNLTPGLKRLRKVGSTSRVESSNDVSLGAQEDASKQGRKIADLDADAEVTLVDETQEMNEDNLMFDTGVLEEQEIEFEKVVEEPVVSVATTTKSIPVSVADPVTTAGEVVTTASASVEIPDELTLAQTLIEIKTAKPKPVTTAATTVTSVRPRAKGIIFHDQEEQVPASTKTFSSSQSQLPQVKDKGKGKMVEPEVPLKKKDQIALDEELALRLHAEEQAELEKERVAQEEASKAAIIEEFDSIQAMIDADEQLAARLQAEEQEQFSIEEKSRMLVEMIAERKKFFAAQRAPKNDYIKNIKKLPKICFLQFVLPKSKNAKVRVNIEESAVKPEPELKNTIECNLYPSDGPGKPNSISMKTVKTKWALNQFQQPICVQLTKTVKTLKAQS
ncbi:hypothetical protein Tco_0290084 [Tanacetum coccineum]